MIRTAATLLVLASASIPAAAERRALDRTTHVIGYLGALHQQRVIGPDQLRELAGRWRSEGRLVNPVPQGFAAGKDTRLLHHEGLSELFAGDLDGEAVARWAERAAARAQQKGRERRTARRETFVPSRPTRFVQVPGGVLPKSSIPRHYTVRDLAIAPFTVLAEPVSGTQWVSAMRRRPQRYPSLSLVPTAHQIDHDEHLLWLTDAEVLELLDRLNARARPRGKRFDLPTDLELEYLFRQVGDDGTWALQDGVLSDLSGAHRSWLTDETMKPSADRALISLTERATLSGKTIVELNGSGQVRLVLRDAR
jgi:hypothetical protein